ncbi:YfiR/HmsC family protein [Teredinibacter purpureus]|uniref:YfiR/HmsC family protein n=1 Tax=Teredinibacter purpureus TaxID=2731756 RepID=UPI0005F7C73C|nr:YfiR/HmsC family protein [Teredinibacter purpureus]
MRINKLRPPSLLTFMLCIGLAIETLSPPAWAFSRDEIIASYLYNFIKTIEWPEQGTLQTITVGVYKPIDPLLPSQLQNHFKGALIHGLPIKIESISSDERLGSLQMLYIEESHNNALESLYRALGSSSTALVTNNYPAKQWVMINLSTTPDNRIQFEINKANMLVQGLTVLPDIILNGGSEIDVAQLFKAGQASLIKVQQNLRDREAQLKQLETGVKTLRSENTSLNTNLKVLQDNISHTQALLNEQKSLITKQRATLEKTNRERLRLTEDVEKKSQQLVNRQYLLEDIGQKIAARETKLKDLNDTLLKQKTTIIEQDDTITTQGIVVNNLIALVFLGLILVGVAVWAYVNKKRDAERLELRGRELSVARDKLATAKARAEDANQAKSEFLSLMSHELRTPLQAIIGYADVVIEDLKLEGKDTHATDLNRVITNSERLLRLINSVLDLAKIESGRMDINLRPVDLESIVADAVANIRPQCAAKRLELIVSASNGIALPIADSEKLLHIILNLLSNACKFTNSGVIKIVAENREKAIYISVQDTGPGISTQQLPFVFDRFQQADASTTRQHQGSGLGLAITKQFCELMGGNIEVHSELLMGTTFTVLIPQPIHTAEDVNELSSAKIRETIKNEKIIKGNDTIGTTILLIDDDDEFINIMTRTLSHEHYSVFSASTANEGLLLAKELNPSIIIIDLLLPDMHGWELFKALKETPMLAGTPLLVASVLDEKLQSELMGADDFLTKPVSRKTIVKAVKKYTTNEAEHP